MYDISRTCIYTHVDSHTRYFNCLGTVQPEIMATTAEDYMNNPFWVQKSKKKDTISSAAALTVYLSQVRISACMCMYMSHVYDTRSSLSLSAHIHVHQLHGFHSCGPNHSKLDLSFQLKMILLIVEPNFI